MSNTTEKIKVYVYKKERKGIAHYIIDDKTMTVKASLPKLTKEEKKELKILLALGYKLERLKEQKEEKNLYNDKKIVDYLKEYNPDDLKIYEDRKNEKLGNGKINKTTGKPKTKGYIAGLSWFKEKYVCCEKTGKFYEKKDVEIVEEKI